MLNSMEKPNHGIGTLAEKSLHAFVKNHIEPNASNHEVKLLGFHVDIFNAQGVVEIQTRQLYKLKAKLDVLLMEYPVTIVHPIPATKTLVWVDPVTYEATKERKSPKRGTIYDAVRELYGLKDRIGHPNLSVALIFYDMRETRWLNGWSPDRKKGSVRHDREPVAWIETIYLGSRQDYFQFLPVDLIDPFTVKDIVLVTPLNERNASLLVGLLKHLKLIEQVGKKGRAYLYQRTH